MFRPMRLQNENTYEFVLMKNRREELMEIPVNCVNNIVFEMGSYVGQPTKLTLTIPSHIERGGEIIEFPLYSVIKGKMQIIVTINDKKFAFTIEEENVVESKNESVKQMVAYERQHKFNATDFSISDTVVTRQLYCKPDENVETADGVLNWFEEYCTGWKVGQITDKARKELTMCSSTQTLVLSSVDKTITENIFEESVNINIGNKPLNFILTMECTVLDSNGREYLSSTLPFNFTNLPYAVSTVSAKYVSTSKNFYGIEFTINYINGHSSTHEFPFLNCKNLRLKANINITYELGDLVENWVTKYRSFESTSCTWMTMLENIAKAFDCLILFDSYNQLINVCHKEEFGEIVNIALTYDNALEEVAKKRKLEDIVTRLWVDSSNTTIASVNILGTDYVECYDYFKTNSIMSEELKTSLDLYNALLVEKDKEFNDLLLVKYEKDQLLTLANSQLVSLQGKYSGENAILSGIIKSATSADSNTGEDGVAWADKQKNQQQIVVDLENQITDKLKEIQQLKDENALLDSQLVEIGIQIKKENAVYNGKKLFNEELLLELSDYVIEKTITDDVHLTAYSLYDYMVEQITSLQKPVIDFSISSSMEFIKRTGQQITDCVFLGAKMEIEDKAQELADEDGTVMLYGFTLNPQTDDVASLNFTNGETVADSPIKAIGRVTQTANTTKSLTDFYKATWEDTRKNNVDVHKIINEGLDLAAQKVRSRTDNNVIEIDEAGIFLIDATNNDNQLALINDLIAMTTDRWQTSKVAISPEGIMAEQLLGQIILSEEVYVGNGENTFKILPDGLYVYDANSSHDLRVFLGIKDGKAKLELYSASGDNSLVLSENGIYSCYQISDRDSFDYYNSFISHFYVPSTLENTFEASLVIRLEKFRAYSKASASETIRLTSTESKKFDVSTTASEKINLTSTETKSFEAKSTGGSGSISVSLSGVSGGSGGASVSGSGTSSYNSQYGVVYTYPINAGSTDTMSGHTHPINTTNFNHTHSVTINAGTHSHSISLTGNASASTHTHSFTVPTHSHSIAMPSHKHEVTFPEHSHNITMPSHGHNLEYGIYEYGTIPNCRVYLNGVDLGVTMNQEKEYFIDITTQFKGLQEGLNTIEIKTTDAKGLGRASFTMFWGGYFSYH